MLEMFSLDERILRLFDVETQAEMRADPEVFKNVVIFSAVSLFVAAVIYILFFLGLLKLNHRVFKKLEKKNGSSLTYQFLEKLIRVIIIVVLIVVPLAGDKLGQSILGSTAVMAAIIGFAGQDIIRDMLSGMLISVYKPFDIGDRIELEDGTVGVIESITMRHVIIIRIDTLRQIIPNSKLNSMSVINYSYGYVSRSMVFKFPVAYDSDIEKTKKVIHDAIKASEYSKADKHYKDGTVDYAPIYFMEIGDSALIMSATVYFDSRVASEVVKDDINTRVFNALRENNIEIPYDYLTLIMKQEEQEKPVQGKGKRRQYEKG